MVFCAAVSWVFDESYAATRFIRADSILSNKAIDIPSASGL